jgi:uncharacterized protein YbaP (TraB family)
VHEGTILDVYLTEEARRLNKTVGGLEPPEHHCEVIDNFFVSIISLRFREKVGDIV